MAKYCRHCGERMHDNAKFCGMCAAPVDDISRRNPVGGRMLRKVVLLMLAVLLVALPVAKLSGGLESKLVGAWYWEENDSYAFTLYDDGTCDIRYEYGTGRWAVVNENKLKMTDFYGESEVAEIVKLTGNKLVLGYGNNTVTLIKKR